MTAIAIIGGSGLDTLAALEEPREIQTTTPYGRTSAPVIRGGFAGRDVYFLARHGKSHAIPPHRVNYRANIAALAALGVHHIVAVTAVGGIAETTPPGRIVIPDQVIDYTYGREHTFHDGIDMHVRHIDFTEPYCPGLRTALVAAASTLGMNVETTGVYGATQGPRLETAAEITRMARDGCTLVGMTGMPEASLARELGLNYANCSLVVNWAAGIRDETISIAEIERQLALGMADVVSLLGAAIPRI